MLQNWFSNKPAAGKIGVAVSSCAGGGSSQAAGAVPNSCHSVKAAAAGAGPKERQVSQDSGVDSGPVSVSSGSVQIAAAAATSAATAADMMGEVDKLKASVASLETELKAKESHITALEAELRAMNRKMQSREAEISRQVQHSMTQVYNAGIVLSKELWF